MSNEGPTMRITALETVRMAERPNLLWLLVHTDEGLSGLGETFFGAATVEAHVHEWIAPRVLGADPLRIDALARDLAGYLGFRSTGAEVRGNSAFDIALWDLWGQATGQPIAQLHGQRALENAQTVASLGTRGTAANDRAYRRRSNLQAAHG